MRQGPGLTTVLLLTAGPLWAEGSLASSVGALSVTPVATDLVEPWAIAFLPDGAFLVTERDGALKLFSGPGADPVLVDGLPEIEAEGQGGLLDVMLPRDFARTREVWLSYAAPTGTGGLTAVGKGRLAEDGRRLEGFTRLFVIPEGSSGGRHFGARLVEAADGTVFLTVGDRGTGPDGMEAQDPQRGEGKVIHLTREGAPATALEGALPGVFSWGHRNPQGATLDLEGRLLLVEHGARGGDELNYPEAGRNYGWPLITYGVNYNGRPIGTGTAQEGMEQPVHYWDPSIAPSGLLVYSGALIPEWRGDILFGSLNSDFLGRLDPDTPAATGFAEERLSGPETARVRDVVEAPDGSIWFLSVINGAAYRLAPET
ncbi:MAG: PQQ-dependent sugar dehydrogenase [Tabrizicola sp.]